MNTYLEVKISCSCSNRIIKIQTNINKIKNYAFTFLIIFNHFLYGYCKMFGWRTRDLNFKLYYELYQAINHTGFRTLIKTACCKKII